MSKLLARIWQTMGKQGRLAGRDLEGNHFYESKVPGDDRRTRRSVEYNRSGDMWDSAFGISGLPAQWTAWLSHTRHEPPTLEELQKDRERQDRLAINVAVLKKQEEDEIRRRNQATLPPMVSTSLPSETMSEAPTAPEPKPIGPTPEPQSWAPRLTRRG